MNNIGLTLLLSSTFFLQSCSQFSCCLGVSFDGKDSVHYLVIGLGVVTVPKPESRTAVLATRAHTIGVQVSDQPGLKLGVGYSSGSVVAIPDTAEDVRVEISEKPGEPLIVDSASSKLRKNKE